MALFRIAVLRRPSAYTLFRMELARQAQLRPQYDVVQAA